MIKYKKSEKERVGAKVNIVWDVQDDDQSMVHRKQRIKNMPQPSTNNFALRNLRENTKT